MSVWRGNTASLSRMTRGWLASPPPEVEPSARIGRRCRDCVTFVFGGNPREADARLIAHQKRAHG